MQFTNGIFEYLPKSSQAVIAKQDMQQTGPYHLFCLLYLYGSIKNAKANRPFLPSINRPNAFFTIEFSQFLAFRKAETDPNGTVSHDILPTETVS